MLVSPNFHTYDDIVELDRIEWSGSFFSVIIHIFDFVYSDGKSRVICRYAHIYYVDHMYKTREKTDF